MREKAMRWTILLALAALGASPVQRAETPAFSIGAIADAQFAEAPDAGQRMYHTAPGKLAAAIEDFNHRKLAFVVHLGDFVDKDWASYDAMLPIARRLRHPL